MTSANMLALRLVPLFAAALLYVPWSSAQDDAAITREDVLALLHQADYEALDNRLNALQRQYEEDDRTEEALLAGFRVFSESQTDLDALDKSLVTWVERYPHSYAARLAHGKFCVRRGLEARGVAYAAKTTARQFEEMERWFERGRAELEASLALSPKPLLSHLALITQAMRSRADDRQELYYRAALVYAPRSIELRVLYMQNLEPRWGGSYEEMEAHAKESEAALGTGPKVHRLYRMIAEDRGDLLMERKQYAAAEAVYTETIERYGGRAVRCGRARARVKLERWPEAMQDMMQALEDPAPHAYCADTAGWLAGTKPDYPGMFELMDGYLQRNPDNVDLLNRRGWALQQRGDLASAYRDYALAAEHGDVWAQTMAGRFVFNGWGGVTQDRERGLALFRAAAESGDANAQQCLTEALQQLGRRDEAVREGQRIAVLKRNRVHSSSAEDPPARAEGWLGYVLDTRMQAVGLGALLMLLIVVRAQRRK